MSTATQITPEKTSGTLACPPEPPASPTKAAQALRQAKKKAEREKHERVFAIHIESLELPAPVREYRFGAVQVGWMELDSKARHKTNLRRRLNTAGLQDWRFDFAWPEYMLAVEIDGAPGKGGHTTAKGYTNDRRKDCEATALGWRVVRVTGDMVQKGYAINLLVRLFRLMGVCSFPDDYSRGCQ